MYFEEYTKKMNGVEWEKMDQILNLLYELFDCQGSIQEVHMTVDGYQSVVEIKGIKA